MIEVYTDGGCSPNPGKGSWAFAISKEHYNSGYNKNTTNNAMEMTAILNAIKYCRFKDKRTPIIIYSDSKYCVDGFMNWMHNWEKRNWFKKGGIKNLDLWKELFSVKNDVTLKWVKGHSGNEMNEFVDSLCNYQIENN